MSTVRQRGATIETGPGSEVGPKMIKVTLEVRSDTAHFRVGVRAEYIRGALSLVAGSHPYYKVAVVFPIEPDGFFVTDPAASAVIVGSEQTHQEAT